ncbi:hypothetical protein GCM10010211_73980 [Streptomyces albospinus]|uniref:Uncharacterized protein n=1 Tax=Streptomyces albospinus TaxID=285515 RepID=A0ABQ2VN05_9ACTN|nr:hypothetical protein GCM10010211_73980 [Streptomyces albospinus]
MPPSPFMAVEPYRLRSTYPLLSQTACADIAQVEFLSVGSQAAAGELAADTNVTAYPRQTACDVAVRRYPEIAKEADTSCCPVSPDAIRDSGCDLRRPIVGDLLRVGISSDVVRRR